MALDAGDVQQLLIEGFPPGVEDFLDLQDDPGKLLLGLAQVLKDHGTDRADQARREATPATCIDQLPEWEGATGLTASDLARFGDTTQRRTQILARLREFGATTLANVRSIVGPLLDYADPSLLAIIEVDRAVLRAAHTRNWTGTLNFNVVAGSLTWLVADDAKVSPCGAQVDLTLTHGEIANLGVSLRAPDGRDLFPDGTTPGPTAPGIGRGPAVGSTVRLYFKGMAGAQIRGTWTLTIFASAGAGTVTSAGLFVEGFGRDAKGNDGLGAAKFHWGPMVEPARLGPKADLKAARAAVKRITYATRAGELLLRSSGAGALPAGQFAAIPDDPGAIPDQCIPG